LAAAGFANIRLFLNCSLIAQGYPGEDALRHARGTERSPNYSL
jgi:hypothetical protein